MSYQSPKNPRREFLKRVLSEQLEADEHVLWSSMPVPARAANQKILGTLLGALFCAAAVYEWFFDKGLSTAGSPYGRTCLLILALLYLGSLVAPFRAAWKARRTLYAITNRRAFVIVMGRQLVIQSFKTFRLGHVETSMNSTGGGDLIFGRAMQYAPGGPRYEREVAFYHLEDVHAAVAALKSSHNRPAYAGVMQSGEH